MTDETTIPATVNLPMRWDETVSADAPSLYVGELEFGYICASQGVWHTRRRGYLPNGKTYPSRESAMEALEAAVRGMGVASPEAADAPWRLPDTAPTNGDRFLAELSNGWVVVLYAHEGIRRRHRYSWWCGEKVSVPYEPTHPADTDWSQTNTMRLTGWMPLPQSRQDAARDADMAREDGNVG